MDLHVKLTSSIARHTTINKTIQLINVLYDTIEDFISNNECSDNRNTKSLVHASKIALCKLQKYYTKTDDNEIYACATMLDCNLKFDYWSESEWEAEVIQQQKNACMTSYKSFLESQFAKRQQPFTTNTAQVAQPMHSSSSTTTTTSTAHNTFNDKTVPSSSALSSSTSSSTATLASGRVKKSFGFFGKRKKINNINETKRQKTDGLSDYIEEGILELHLYTTSDDTDTFPPLELEYYATKIDDDLILIDEKVEMTMKEEGFAGQTLSSLDSSNSHSGSIPLPVPSKFLLNQSIDYSQLNNNLNFATQSLDFWRLNHIKYPKLSSFALQILAVPSTSVASERLFSTAKRIININRASLSGESAELLVVLSNWKKHQCDA